MTERAGRDGIASRLASFTLIPFLGNLMPLVALPIVARVTTADGWAAIAIGQSAGMVGLLAVDYGWTLRGPVEVAQADRRRRSELHAENLMVVIPLLIAVGVIAATVSWLIAPHGSGSLAAAMAAAAATAGLSPVWFVVGSGNPRDLLKYDMIPRTASLGLAVLLMLQTDAVWWYPAAIAVGSILGIALFAIRVSRPTMPAGSWRSVLSRRLRRNSSAALTSLTAGSYSNGAMLVVGASATPAVTAVTSSADRLFKAALLAVAALTNALQAWVVEGGRAQERRRQGISLAAHAALGISGMVAFAVAAPYVTAWLFGTDLASDRWTCFWYGVAFLFLALNSCVGRHVLMVRGDDRGVMAAALGGAILGVPAIAVGASQAGAPGAAAGLAIGELAVVLVQAARCYQIWGSTQVDR